MARLGSDGFLFVQDAPNDAYIYFRHANGWQSSGAVAGAISTGGIVTVNGGSIRTIGTAPVNDLDSSGAPANQKFSRHQSDTAGNLHWQLLNDAYTAANEIIYATRSGYTLSGLTFGPSWQTFDSSGNATFSATLNAASLTTSGEITANGHACRAGQGGALSGNQFNINWTGTNADLWIDVTNEGHIATQSFIAGLYAPLASPTFTGTVTTAALTTTGTVNLSSGATSTTPAAGDNSANVATTAYVKAQTWGYPALPAEVQQVPVNFPYPGKPPPSGAYGNSSRLSFPISLWLPANCAGSRAQCDTAPSANAQFYIYHAPYPGNGPAGWSQIGTITFYAGTYIGYFSSSAQTYNAGDMFAINCPGSQDGNLAYVAITLLFWRL
jgi:hypothetical protein